MTTIYPVDGHVRCPIIHRCLKQLKAMVGSLLFEDEDDQLGDLALRYAAASGHPSLVGLRGFRAIEKMLEMLRGIRPLGQLPPIPTLTTRSWGGLTTIKGELEKVLDNASITVAELQLQGVQFGENNLVVVTSSTGNDKDMSTASYMGTSAIQMQTLAKVAIHSITVLRPYLRNEAVSVSIIGDELGFFVREVYGALAAKPLIEMTRELLDVRL